MTVHLDGKPDKTATAETSKNTQESEIRFIQYVRHRRLAIKFVSVS